MPINVRAALALSLPVGLLALSAGGAIVGGPSVAGHDPAHEAQVRSTDERRSSSPPANLLLAETVSEAEKLGHRSALPQPPLAPADEVAAVREPYEIRGWSKQYALRESLHDDAAPLDRAEQHYAALASSPSPWQAAPIQYVQIESPANAPQLSTPQPSPPLPSAGNAPAPTPLPLSPESRSDARPPAALDLAALAPVSQQAQLRVDEAFRYARRGALYAARAELIQSLRMIAQAVDTLEQDNRRSRALAAGFNAMKEAEDFFVRSDTLEHDLDVEGMVLAHRTPVLKGQSLAGVSALAALQQYYAYAQQQFSLAAAGTPAGSRALYGLGKVHMTLARESSDDRSHQTPKAMAFFQAAMQADGRNYLAANELGVLLAQFGQLAEAKRVLVHSVSVQSHAEGWQNLAVVHGRLGEQDLARKANYERELLVARSAGQPSSDRPVTWVGPREFNSLGGPDAMAAAPAYAPAKSSNTTRR